MLLLNILNIESYHKKYEIENRQSYFQFCEM